MIVAPRAETPADVARRLTGRDYVSYSALGTYAACPLKYYFRYVLGLPEETVSASLALGSCLHAALEHHFRELLAGAPPPALDALRDVFWEAWRAKAEEATIEFGRDESVSTLEALATRLLTAFQSSELARPAGRIVGVEEELRGELATDLPPLLARLDLLVETREAVVLTDFKTSRCRWTEDQARDSAAQLVLYGELVRELCPGKPLRLEFAVLTKTKAPVVERHVVECGPREAARATAVARRVWRAIASGHFYPSPSPLQCPSCAYRAACRAWEG